MYASVPLGDVKICPLSPAAMTVPSLKPMPLRLSLNGSGALWTAIDCSPEPPVVEYWKHWCPHEAPL